MKKVVCRKSRIETVSLDRVHNDENLTSQTIIAYVTNAGTGLGVQCIKKDFVKNYAHYGFKYHKDLVMQRQEDRLRYVSNTKVGSLELVLNAGRELLIFNDFKEFVAYADNHCKL